MNGECLLFEARWNFAPLGKAMMVCQEENNIRFGKVYHHLGITVPAGLPAKLGYGSNRVDAYVNPETLEPYYFYSYTRAGKTERVIEVDFNSQEKTFSWVAKKYKGGKLTESKGSKVKFSPPIYDSLGVFYKLRIGELEKGKKTRYSVAVTKIWDLTVEYKQIIRRKLPFLGLKDFLVLEPEIASDEGWFDKGKLAIWLTADGLRLPACFQGKIVFGNARLDLIYLKKLEPTVVLNQETITSLLASI
ncbi:MAG: DUF3108 domain-containing protein [Candidatus Omnitrophica bacterium]|nr:DUF3108 domain-containing protein [Candidatus Omnitrophota bacterium]